MNSGFGEEVLFGNFPGGTPKKYPTYKGTVLYNYKPIVDSIENFEVRDDDVYVCTTWMLEMVWSIVHDLDLEGAQVSMNQRMPYLGSPRGFRNDQTPGNDTSDYHENIAKLPFPKPRVIKTHLPFHLLPRQLREGGKKSKIVHVSRNPKDVCVSYYHVFRANGEYGGTIEDFGEDFLNDRVTYAPYWDHVNGYHVREANEGNLLCVTFEDMKSDLRSTMARVAKFLGKRLNTRQMEKLEEHLSFDSMQKNPAVNREDEVVAARCEGIPREDKLVIRSGEVGQWRTVMSEELIGRFDEWIEANSKQF